MLTTVFLSGELAKKFGRRHQFDIRTPKEALRAIEANRPGLSTYLAQATDRGIDFRIQVGKDTLGDASLVDFKSRGRTIRISPVVRGAKNKATGLIIGLALVAITWGAAAGALPFFQALNAAGFAGNAFGIAGLTWGAVTGSIGISMAVSGLSQMLSPTPKVDVGRATESSYLGGPVNATVQGLPVPLIYGGPIVAGAIRVSAGIKSEDKSGSTAAKTGITGTQGEGPFTDDTSYPTYSAPASTSNVKGRNLESVQVARILDLICEGEIEGLCDSTGALLSYADRHKGIFFERTQVQADDGTFNFKDAATAIRFGTNAQEYLPGFPETESTTAVGLEVIKGGDKVANAISRTIAAGTYDALRVDIQIPALWKIDAKGNQVAAAVHFGIHIKPSGGSWTEAVGSNALDNGELDGLIQGFATQPYSRSYRIPLEGAGPWDVRILKETADAADPTKEQSKLYFTSYTTIVDQRLRYPNSVVAGVEVSSKISGSIPETAYRVKGLKIQIPSNYNPTTRNYSGTWDGTFTTAWTNNPAWVFYDLITNQRYGLGKFIPAAYVDKWALYSIARYCDGVDGSGTYVGVDDGNGGVEPRYSLNVVISNLFEAWKLLQDIASAFRAMVYWSAGQVSLVQDAPTDPSFVFTNANVIEGLFNYSGTAKKARHSVALVGWRDPADPFSNSGAVEYVEDAASVARYGINETQPVAFGCTSRGQAQRLGRWLLYSERLEDQTVTFVAGMEGARLRPGIVIQTRDRYRTTNRMGGRIVSIGAGTVTLDSAITISGASDTLTIAQTDGSVIEYPITTGAGSATTVALTGSLSLVAVNAVFIHSTPAAVPQEWRVLNVKETAPNTFEVVAAAFASAKFTDVETGVNTTPLPTSDLPSVTTPAAPSSVTIRQNRVFSGAVVAQVLDINWTASVTAYVVGYKVELRGPNGSWETLAERAVGLSLNSIPWTAEGDYSARVSAVNVAGRTSPAVQTTLAVTLDTTAPGLVTSLSATAVPGGVALAWTNPTDADFLAAGWIEIYEYTASTPAPDGSTTATFRDAVVNAYTRGGLAAGATRYYWVRAVDPDGNKSAWEGPVNATATAGPTGATGATGAAGATGSTGPTGPTGLAGLDGSTTFYSVAASVPSALQIGDLWFVTDQAFELRRATATGTGSWVATLYTGSAPFEIISGTTYVKKAAIRELDAGVILAGTITAALTINSPTLNTPLITGGTIKLSGASTLCANTSDGSDNSIVRLNGGGADGQTRGGQVDVLGNEYVAVAGYGGSVLITPGNHSDGAVYIRSRDGLDRIIVKTSGSVNFYGAVDCHTNNLVGVNDLSCNNIDCVAVKVNSGGGAVQVVGGRGAAVGDADHTTASTTIAAADMAGSDTVSRTWLAAYFNALDAIVNGNAVLQNTLRDRLKASGGHGLIA